MSIHELRADGPDLLHHHSPVQNAVYRAEMELACEEMLLRHGAPYLASLLDNDPKAIR